MSGLGLVLVLRQVQHDLLDRVRYLPAFAVQLLQCELLGRRLPRMSQIGRQVTPPLLGHVQ